MAGEQEGSKTGSGTGVSAKFGFWKETLGIAASFAPNPVIQQLGLAGTTALFGIQAAPGLVRFIRRREKFFEHILASVERTPDDIAEYLKRQVERLREGRLVEYRAAKRDQLTRAARRLIPDSRVTGLLSALFGNRNNVSKNSRPGLRERLSDLAQRNLTKCGQRGYTPQHAPAKARRRC